MRRFGSLAQSVKAGYCAFRPLVVALFAAVLASGPVHGGGRYQAIHHFDGDHGGYPQGGLALDDRATLYGTTRARRIPFLYTGVLFGLNKTGYKVLHYFTGGPTDGENPIADLKIDSQGRLLGTTSGGGVADYGTVFRYDRITHYQVIYMFSGGPDGGIPWATPTEGDDGALYGTASYGGGDVCDCGTVYRLDPRYGTLTMTTLHRFSAVDGSSPFSDLLLQNDRLSGVTVAGLPGNTGSPFSLGLDGTGFEVVSPVGGGEEFRGGLTPDSHGNLWGITRVGGDRGVGTIYRVDSAGQLDVVFSFGGSDGENPTAKLLMGSDGMLYGSTYYGGDRLAQGTLFRFDPVTLVYTKLYSFKDGSGGSNPTGALVQDVEGNLYGVAQIGGLFGKGVVFRFTP